MKHIGDGGSRHEDIAGLQIDNRFVRELPADTDVVNLPRPVLHACYSRVMPQRVAAPKLLACFMEVASSLGLNEDICASDAFTQLVSGQTVPAAMEPYAMCYGGHQFGHWAGQLGDGRAITLGEIVDRNGVNQSLQLKGAGPTPYSRRADGLAVLRSSMREFLCSEAMHHLGIPTTRALSLVLTGDQVVRDMFYDGNPRPEPGAIVARVAPTFLRFGNYQLFAARNDLATLQKLADFTIRHYFTHLYAAIPQARERYLAWFREVARATIDMVVHWQRVGFVHGVMNTDNMSVLGLTIDYGPYGWMENVDPQWTPNTTDAGGRRYCYANQPYVALWNLAQFANAIAPLTGAVDKLQAALLDAEQLLESSLRKMRAAKLGLANYDAAHDDVLFAELDAVFARSEIDMTLFYRALAKVPKGGSAMTDDALFALVGDAVYGAGQSPDTNRHDLLISWIRSYIIRLQLDDHDDAARIAAMERTNPAFVLRNYLVQLAIDAAQESNFDPMFALMDALRMPYAGATIPRDFLRKRPDWARDRAGCSMLSCSS